MPKFIASDPRYQAEAAEAIPGGVFVSLRSTGSPGQVYISTNVEADARGLLGYAPKAASAGKSIILYVEGDVVPGFSGLTPGAQYWLDVSAPGLDTDLVANQWTRPVGIARDATHLELRFGDVQQVGGDADLDATETYSATAAVKIGDTTNNPTIDHPGTGAVTYSGNPTHDFGTGQADFGGNLDANAGLDVSGGALTVANQPITQTTGGQVTFAGNVDCGAGVDVTGNITVTGTVDGVDVADLIIENNDLQLDIPLEAGLADGGTWTKAITSSGEFTATRTAADAADSFWVPIPVSSRTTASRGCKPTGLRVNYTVGTADVADVRFEVWKITEGADGSQRTAAVLFGEDNADYDEAHNSAPERGDDTGNPEAHLAIVTDTGTPAYLAAGEALKLRCYVDGDAGPNGVVEVTKASLVYTERRIDG